MAAIGCCHMYMILDFKASTVNKTFGCQLTGLVTAGPRDTIDGQQITDHRSQRQRQTGDMFVPSNALDLHQRFQPLMCLPAVASSGPAHWLRRRAAARPSAWGSSPAAHETWKKKREGALLGVRNWPRWKPLLQGACECVCVFCSTVLCFASPTHKA